MHVLPELEAYQERLVDRARAWGESARETLTADLLRCDEQVRLLERSLEELEAALGALPEPGEEAEGLEEARRRAEHRKAVLAQTRDLTRSYAQVLRQYLAGREQH